MHAPLLWRRNTRKWTGTSLRFLRYPVIEKVYLAQTERRWRHMYNLSKAGTPVKPMVDSMSCPPDSFTCQTSLPNSTPNNDLEEQTSVRTHLQLRGRNG